MSDRDLVAILALDVLEHVVEPRAVVEVLAQLAMGREDCSLLVSIPNVTHRDVVTRLLLGRWDVTRVGLLDDSHLRFFSPDGLHRLFDGTGWSPADALDTTAEYTEQFTLTRSPALQPGAPVGDFLRRLRARAVPHATTYQFVRRFVFDPAAESAPEDVDADRPAFVSIIVSGASGGAGDVGLVGDLEAQNDGDFVLVRLGDTWDFDEISAAARAARSHYAVFLDASDRVGPDFVAALRRGASDPEDSIATDCVVRLDAALLHPD